MEKLFDFGDGVEERRTFFFTGEDDSGTVGLFADTGVDDGFEKEF